MSSLIPEVTLDFEWDPADTPPWFVFKFGDASICVRSKGKTAVVEFRNGERTQPGFSRFTVWSYEYKGERKNCIEGLGVQRD